MAAAKRADLKSELRGLIATLHKENEQLYLRERSEADNLEALA